MKTNVSINVKNNNIMNWIQNYQKIIKYISALQNVKQIITNILFQKVKNKLKYYNVNKHAVTNNIIL